jgi:hypothetical protein
MTVTRGRPRIVPADALWWVVALSPSTQPAVAGTNVPVQTVSVTGRSSAALAQVMKKRSLLRASGKIRRDDQDVG